MAPTVEFAQSANVFACCAMVPPASAISLSGLNADTDTVYLSQFTLKGRLVHTSLPFRSSDAALPLQAGVPSDTGPHRWSGGGVVFVRFV